MRGTQVLLKKKTLVQAEIQRRQIQGYGSFSDTARRGAGYAARDAASTVASSALMHSTYIILRVSPYVLCADRSCKVF